MFLLVLFTTLFVFFFCFSDIPMTSLFEKTFSYLNFNRECFKYFFDKELSEITVQILIWLCVSVTTSLNVSLRRLGDEEKDHHCYCLNDLFIELVIIVISVFLLATSQFALTFFKHCSFWWSIQGWDAGPISLICS